MPLQSDLAKLYTGYYTHAGEMSDIPKQIRSSAIRRAIANLVPWRKVQLLPRLFYLEDLPAGRLLEVGCGAGAFLKEAACAGWSALGVDFDEQAVFTANRRPGVKAIATDIYDSRLPVGEFDALVMNNVIEHLPEPERVFARCAELVRFGGRLVMITPNIDARCHKIFGPDWRGLETPRHLVLYNARSLRALALQAGFRSAQAFSPVSGNIRLMASMSAALAEAAGRTPPRVDIRTLQVKSVLSWLMGRALGEWVVLVAEK